MSKTNERMPEGYYKLFAVVSGPPSRLCDLQPLIMGEFRRIELLKTASEIGAGDQQERIARHDAGLKRIAGYMDANMESGNN